MNKSCCSTSTNWSIEASRSAGNGGIPEDGRARSGGSCQRCEVVIRQIYHISDDMTGLRRARLEVRADAVGAERYGQRRAGAERTAGGSAQGAGQAARR